MALQVGALKSGVVETLGAKKLMKEAVPLVKETYGKQLDLPPKHEAFEQQSELKKLVGKTKAEIKDVQRIISSNLNSVKSFLTSLEMLCTKSLQKEAQLGTLADSIQTLKEMYEKCLEEPKLEKVSFKTADDHLQVAWVESEFQKKKFIVNSVTMAFTTILAIIAVFVFGFLYMAPESCYKFLPGFLITLFLIVGPIVVTNIYYKNLKLEEGYKEIARELRPLTSKIADLEKIEKDMQVSVENLHTDIRAIVMILRLFNITALRDAVKTEEKETKQRNEAKKQRDQDKEHWPITNWIRYKFLKTRIEEPKGQATKPKDLEGVKSFFTAVRTLQRALVQEKQKMDGFSTSLNQ